LVRQTTTDSVLVAKNKKQQNNTQPTKVPGNKLTKKLQEPQHRIKINARSMSRLPSKLRDFLMVQKRFTTQPNFSNALGLSPKHILQKDDSEIKPLVSTSKEGDAQYCFRYVVPNHACIKSMDGKDYVFPTSAILAVFDDLTTLAIVNEDKNARPGVSTSLSANLSPYGMTRLPKAGDELDICVKVIKIGKTFGFAEAEAHCSETGAVIAIGKHTKFLNTGSLLQSVILGPTILPIASRVASMYQPKDLNATNTISMSDLFCLEPSKEKRDGSILVLRKEHMNPMGTCHVRCLPIMFSLH